jgi:uncharacterized iron-regulated membrane protein
MLFVIAWSSVAFNLPQVYGPVMKSLFAHQHEPVRAMPPAPNHSPALDWPQARETARRLMRQQAQRHGFEIVAEDWFGHDPANNLYFYDVRSSLDVSERKGATRLFFDADSGELLHIDLPTGAAAGDTIRTWITSLHRVEPWGLPFKLFMMGMGLVVVMLSVTGLLIWLRKRAASVRSGSLNATRTRETRQSEAISPPHNGLRELRSLASDPNSTTS